MTLWSITFEQRGEKRLTLEETGEICGAANDVFRRAGIDPTTHEDNALLYAVYKDSVCHFKAALLRILPDLAGEVEARLQKTGRKLP